jgi:hypothetical protein
LQGGTDPRKDAMANDVIKDTQFCGEVADVRDAQVYVAKTKPGNIFITLLHLSLGDIDTYKLGRRKGLGHGDQGAAAGRPKFQNARALQRRTAQSK